MYAIISAVEQDLRCAVASYLGPNKTCDELFAPEMLTKLRERLRADEDVLDEENSLERLLDYADFADTFQLLATNKSLLLEHIATHFTHVTPKLERLTPIRNRVMHIRPYHYDDLAVVTNTAEELLELPAIWINLELTMSRLKNEPGFVLGLEIPAFQWDGVDKNHNLPIPDFDETGFVGRKAQIDDLKKQCFGPYPVISVLGPGGTGKTALALKVAYDILDEGASDYRVVVWSTSKTQQLTPQQIVNIEGAICDSLGMLRSVAEQLGQGGQIDPFEAVLAYMKEFPLFLVLDNLETVIDDNIKRFFSKIPKGSKVLITSRTGLGAYDFPYVVPDLPADEAIQLLRALAKVRGVPQLGRSSNKQIEIYCNRLKNNPGFIKWFVSAVQAGVRPEEVLDKTDLFYDFCMSNVYKYLSEESRNLLRCVAWLSGQRSQAELAFLSGMKPDDLQRALRQLQNSNMVILSSIPRGASFESKYELADLAREYLLRHHPTSPEEARRLGKREQELIHASEHLTAEHRANPYSAYTLNMRSNSDLIVAKYLYDALGESRRKNFTMADHFIAEARRLAPQYFEVHRVDAWVKVEMRNFSGARVAYEAALELEPRYSPLRLWYGGFLLRCLNKVKEALDQFRIGEQIDPRSFDLQREIACANLYLRDFEKARNVIDQLLLRDDLPEWNRRKVYDLHLQYFQRKAELQISQQEYHGTLKSLKLLKNAYEQCPSELLDAQMKTKLSRAVTSAKSCARFLNDEAARSEAREIEDWMLQQHTLIGGFSLRGYVPLLRTGKVRQLVVPKGYGFLQEGNKSIFFHRSSLRDHSTWENLRVGQSVTFELETPADGRPKAVRIAVNFDETLSSEVANSQPQKFHTGGGAA